MKVNSDSMHGVGLAIRNGLEYSRQIHSWHKNELITRKGVDEL